MAQNLARLRIPHLLQILIPGLGLLLACCAGGPPGSQDAPDAQDAPDPPFAGRVRSVFAEEDGLKRQPGLRPLSSPWTGSLAMALPGVIDPAHAPRPAGDPERVAFAHMYETLTRLDSAGEAVPALASAWTSTGGGRSWILTLRSGASFWNGEPVTAAAVGASWLAGARRAATLPAPPTPLAWLGLRAENLRVIDDRTLALDLPEPVTDLPVVLAHPALAVRGPLLPGQVWPQGSGPCRPADPAQVPEQELTLIPHAGHPRAPRWSALTLLLDPEGIADKSVDLALTRSGDAAAMLPAPVQVLTLPWDRLYLLVCPPPEFGTTARDRQRWTADWSSRGLVADLGGSWTATARPVDSWTFYGRADRFCPLLRQPVTAWNWPDFAWPTRTAARDADLILFPDDDPLAAALAGLLAVHAARPLRPGPDLAGRGPLTPPDRATAGLAPQALGLDRAEFTAALQAGRAGAYVLPVDRQDGSDCRQLAALVGRALWLQEAAGDPDVSHRPLPQGARAADPVSIADPGTAEHAALRLLHARILLPMVAGRATLAARPGLAGIVVDFQGTIDLTLAGYHRPGGR